MNTTKLAWRGVQLAVTCTTDFAGWPLRSPFPHADENVYIIRKEGQ